MKKEASVVFLGILVFLYLFNFLTPMSFGDDYLYSFVWQGQSMFIPVSEDAVRISSWHDLFVSQISHYLTWSGRTVNHTIAQLSLWGGKDSFNFCNAFVGTLLVAEIYWCMNQGKISKDFRVGTVCWIFFCLWSFSPGFAPVYFWLDGACNYLWTSVILLGFFLVYINKYYGINDIFNKSQLKSVVMFFWGVIAGWTNENSVCWIILVLIMFLYHLYRKRIMIETWMYTGLAGLISGYTLLMLAPGNFVRFRVEKIDSGLPFTKMLFDNFSTLLMILFFQLFLWYFILKSFYQLQHNGCRLEEAVKRELLLVKVLCIISFGMSSIMMFSPVFPPRSGFPGTIPLIIAAGILLRLQDQFSFVFLNRRTKIFLFCISVSYFVMTSVVSFYNYYGTYKEMQGFLDNLMQAQKNEIVIVKPLKKASEVDFYLSGFHLFAYELADNENDWRNVALSRYFGLKGIRMIH